jgi:hypothetical protein
VKEDEELRLELLDEKLG